MLLLDEMLTPMIAEQLRDRGHDVIAVAESWDLVGASDEDVLAAATAQRRTIVTRNIADFRLLHDVWTSAGRRHHGILFVHTTSFGDRRSAIGPLLAALDLRLRESRLPDRGAWEFVVAEP